MAGNTVIVNIVGDASKLSSALSKAGSDTESFASKMQAAGAKIAGIGAKMTLGITAPLAILGKLSFDAASDLNESLSKVNVVFGESADEIVKWSKTAAESMGISQQAALESAGTFGNLFRALGLTETAATDMSMQLVQLASDLASFNNANPEDVLIALRAGLVGEVEPLRKFGVSLSAVRVEAEALADGLVQPIADLEEITRKTIAVEKANVTAAKALKASGEESLDYRDALAAVTKAEEDLAEATSGKVPDLTAAQKAQAAYNIILKDTTLSQGDFARTADGAANKQRILAAQFKDMQAQLGQTLIPIFQKVAAVLQDVAKWFDNLTPRQQELIVYAGLAVAALGPLLTVLGGLIAVVGALISPITLVVLTLAAVAAAAYLLWTNWDQVWTWIMDHPAYAAIIAILASPIASFVLLIGGLKTLWENWDSIWGYISSSTRNVVGEIENGLSPIITAIEVIIDGLKRIKKFWDDLPGRSGTGQGGSGPIDFNNLLGFSEGGFVPGSGNRDSVPALLTPGEFVVSKAMMQASASVPSSVGGNAGGAGINITVNAGIGTDGAEVGRQIVAAIANYERGSGKGWRN